MTDKIFSDGILNGHVAFVTGGGTGITGGVARALAEAGANVALVSRSMDHLEAATRIITQNRTVLTVEFTYRLLKTAFASMNRLLR